MVAGHLSVGVGAVVAQHQVGPPAVQQQVGGLEGQREALDPVAEVIRVPQEVVGGVHEEVLKGKRRTKGWFHPPGSEAVDPPSLFLHGFSSDRRISR